MKIGILIITFFVIAYFVCERIGDYNRGRKIPESIRVILHEADNRTGELKSAEVKIVSSIHDLEEIRDQRVSKLRGYFWSSTPKDSAIERANEILKELNIQLSEVRTIIKEIDEKKETILIEAKFGHVITVDSQNDLKKQLEMADKILVNTNRELNNSSSSRSTP